MTSISEINHFDWPDYLVFAFMLAISSIIGLYYACHGSRQNTTKDFFMGGKNMGVFPVAMSLAASFFSAVGLMGLPAEVFRFGTMLYTTVFSYLLTAWAANSIYIPIFHRLQVTSVYEYLERRFHPAVRRFGSTTLIIQMTLYMSVVILSPSLALSQVTGLDVYVSVTVNFAVCIFYTALGGLKAVLWTDTFQMFVIFGSVMTIIIKGTYNAGGFSTIFHDAYMSGRIELIDFNPDPFMRHNFWSLIIGGYFVWTSLHGVNQTQVQRYLSIATLKQAQRALRICIFITMALTTVVFYTGLLVYSKYKDCNPIQAKYIQKSDQIFPFYVMDTLGAIPGFAGLFVAGLFSGSLSTVSSGLNSLAAITLEDLIRPLFCSSISDRRATQLSKGLAVFYGVISYAIIYIVININHLAEAVIVVFGLCGGPLLGLFTLGIIFPWANTAGAISGLISGLLATFWVGFGSLVARINGEIVDQEKPTSIAGCESIFHWQTPLNDTISVTLSDTHDHMKDFHSEPFVLYKLSYMWFSALGFFTVIIIGLIVSGIVGFQDPKRIDPELICDVGETLFWYLPKRMKEFLRFKVGDEYKKPRLSIESHLSEDQDNEKSRLNMLTVISS